jgi:hypothetical protein
MQERRWYVGDVRPTGARRESIRPLSSNFKTVAEAEAELARLQALPENAGRNLAVRATNLPAPKRRLRNPRRR